LNFCCLGHDDVTWDSSKGSCSKEQKGERGEDETQSFKEEYEELEVLAIENHILCFDIAQILNVVLDFFQQNMGLC
jgi:hypothetical protein